MQQVPWTHAQACSHSHLHTTIDVKKRFLRFLLFFIKNAFLTFFIFGNVFYFLVANFFIVLNLLKILLNLPNSCIKRLLSDGFNTTAIKHSLMKSRSPQKLSCVLRR